jgi:molecular chaperone DnaJ
LYEKDLYQILGVSKGDSADVIKKQYRKLARELHPDKTKGDKKLEDRFKAVSEAYEVLSDDAKRGEYDQMRDAIASGRIPPGAHGGGNNFGGANFQDLFGGGQFDGGDIFANLFGGGGRRAPRKGADLQSEISISFRDSLNGCEKNISANGQTISVKVPAGIKDGQKIKKSGHGAKGEAGPGDLLIVVHVAPHPVFTRDELNLKMNLPVTFVEAALGADISVPLINGEEVKVRLAPGTASGKTLRVKGRGVTKGAHTGDLLITIDVQVPQRVDGKAKEALVAFAAATSDHDPREHLAQRARA